MPTAGPGNQVIREQEAKQRASQIRAAFAVFDTDGNGTLSPTELKAILTRPTANGPAKFTEAQINELIKQFDKNGDGVLSVDEFTTAFSSLVEEKVSLEEMMALVAAPAGEDFSDLVAKGAGCKIAKVEERAITTKQLQAVKAHIERRCKKESWLSFEKKPLSPQWANLYEVCAHVIKVCLRETPHPLPARSLSC